MSANRQIVASSTIGISRKSRAKRIMRQGRATRARGAFGEGLRGGGDRLGVRQPRSGSRTGGLAAPAMRMSRVSSSSPAASWRSMSAVTRLRPLQPLAQALLAFAHRRLQAGDGALGDFGGGDQFGNGRAQRLLVGLEQAKLLVEPHAIQDREQQQDRDHGLDQISIMIAHGASIRLVGSSAFSNMAKVVRGLRKRLGDAHRDAVADFAHAAFGQRDVAAAHGDQRVRLELERQRVADVQAHHLAQRQPRLVEHGIDARSAPGRFRWPDGLPRSGRGRTSRP